MSKRPRHENLLPRPFARWLRLFLKKRSPNSTPCHIPSPSPPTPSNDALIFMESWNRNTTKPPVFFNEPVFLVQQCGLKRRFCGKVVLIGHPSEKLTKGFCL